MRKSVKIALLLLAGIIITLAAVSGFIVTTFDRRDYREALTGIVNRFSDYQVEIVEPFTAEISLRPSFSAAAVKLVIPDNPKPLTLHNLKLKLVPAALIYGKLRMQIAGLIDDQDSLRLLLPEELDAVDAITVVTQLTTNGSKLKLGNLKIKAANDRGLNLEINGNGLIEDFSAAQPFTKLDLLLKIIAPDSRSLKGYLPDNLPELGQVRGRLRLVAVSDQELAAREINLNFNRTGNGLKTTVAGEIAHIPVDPDTANNGIDLQIELHSPDTVSISKLLRQPLPEVGPVRVKTRLRDREKELTINNLELYAGNAEALEIKTNGGLSFTEYDPNSQLILKQLNLTTAISAPAGARLPAFSKTAETSFKVPVSGPLSMTFKLIGDDKQINLNDFSAILGKTAVKADLKVVLTGKRPQLIGKISAQTVDFNDFRRSPADSQKPDDAPQKMPEAEKPNAAKSDQTLLLSRQSLPRNWLHRLDCDIDLSLDKITGLQKGLSDLEFVLKLEDGRLRLDPASFVFENGAAEFSLLINDRDPTTLPEMKLRGKVDDLELTALMELLNLDTKISGKLTAHTELKSRGLSLHELAANLDGPFEAALEDGQIPSQYLKLVAVDFLGWSFDQVLMQNHLTEIGCSILALEAKKGLLTCKAFILESPHMIITGAGTADLKTETCDLTLYPKKKRKFWALVTPVNIKGPIQDPQVITIPVKTAALLYGGALLAPQFFLPAIGLNYLWEKVSKDKKGAKSPCFEYLQQKR